MSDIKQLWQSQERERDMITLADIQVRSTKFRGRIRWRNILIGGYSLYAAATLIVWLFRHPNTELAASAMPGIILTLAAHLWILFALWWRGRARSLPGDLAGEAALDFHRRELERQRDAAASAWVWYILPFMPATAAAFWLLAAHKFPNTPQPFAFVVGMFCVLFFLAIWLAFSRSAARLDLELERLNRLRAE